MTWSAQTTKLQLSQSNKDNKKAQGQGFFKMTEEDISTVQEDLAQDLYEQASSHREEITRLMEEFDAHDIDTSVKLDKYERNQQQQIAELGSPSVPQPPP